MLRLWGLAGNFSIDTHLKPTHYLELDYALLNVGSVSQSPNVTLYFVFV